MEPSQYEIKRGQRVQRRNDMKGLEELPLIEKREGIIPYISFEVSVVSFSSDISSIPLLLLSVMRSNIVSDTFVQQTKSMTKKMGIRFLYFFT